MVVVAVTAAAVVAVVAAAPAAKPWKALAWLTARSFNMDIALACSVAGSGTLRTGWVERTCSDWNPYSWFCHLRPLPPPSLAPERAEDTSKSSIGSLSRFWSLLSRKTSRAFSTALAVASEVPTRSSLAPLAAPSCARLVPGSLVSSRLPPRVITFWYATSTPNSSARAVWSSPNRTVTLVGAA